MAPSPVYTLKDLAETFGYSTLRFRRMWRGLVKDHGFPRPLPGLRLVWPRLLVDIWIKSGGVSVPRPANTNEFNPAQLEAGSDDTARLIAAQRDGLTTLYVNRPRP